MSAGARSPDTAKAVLVGLAGAVALGLSAWSVGAMPVRRVASTWDLWRHIPQMSRFVGNTVWFVGVALLTYGWLLLRRVIAGRSPWFFVGVAGLWALPLMAGPPVGTRDAYSYVAQGAIRSAGYDPGIVAPVALSPLDPVFVAVDPIWRTNVSPYGPAHTVMAWSSVALAHGRVVASVIYLRIWAAVGVAALAVAVVWLARSTGRDPTGAVWMAIANPLTIVHIIGGAHNEAVMAALVVAGLAVAVRWPRTVGLVAGSVVVGLGAAVKLPALAAAVWLGVRHRGDPPARRAALGAVALAIAVATIAAVGALTDVGWGWATAVRGGGRVNTVLSISAAVGWSVLRPIPILEATRRHIVNAFESVVQVVSMALAAVMVWRSDEPGRLEGHRGLAMALILVAVASPAVHPWYLFWGLPIMAVVDAASPRRWLIATSIVFTAAALPRGGGVFTNPGRVPFLVPALAVIGYLMWRRFGHFFTAPTVSDPATIGAGSGRPISS